jgi:hypothetical protein
MSRNALILVSDTSTVADTAAVYLSQSGRYALVISATTYPTTVQLQVLDQNAATPKWVPLNSSNITADGSTGYDCPAGQYRMHLTGGSASHLNAQLVPISYN